LPPLALLVLHDHARRNRLGLEVRLEAAYFGSFAFGVGQHQHTGEPFDGLKGERTLAPAIGASALSARE